MSERMTFKLFKLELIERLWWMTIGGAVGLLYGLIIHSLIVGLYHWWMR